MRHEQLSVTELTLGSGLNRIVGTAAAAPTTGTYNLGDMVLNGAPAATEFIGWVCVAAGTPGTWKGFGAIEA